MIQKIKNTTSLAYKIATNIKFFAYYRKAIMLRSIQKSGTNYLRLILTNYFFNINRKKETWKEINYDTMHFTVFPNVRNHVFEAQCEYIPPQNKIKKNKGYYSDFMYDHGSDLDSMHYIKPAKLILLYRNPLDHLVSIFYYKFKNRPGQESKYEHPRDLISKRIPGYAKKFDLMTRLNTHNADVMISYEELKLNPEETIVKLLNFLNIHVMQDLIRFSLEASSINKVKEDEKKRGEPIHSSKHGLHGSFVRSGAIGDWKNYFSEQDIFQIRNILTQHNIDLNQFILEPPCQQ